ncbi:glycoside hydrolase family 2 [Streptomyces hirsutus]
MVGPADRRGPGPAHERRGSRRGGRGTREQQHVRAYRRCGSRCRRRAARPEGRVLQHVRAGSKGLRRTRRHPPGAADQLLRSDEHVRGTDREDAEHTTARWTGQIEAPETGDYTFHAIGDNGFRLFIDDKPVIDHWEPDWDRKQTSEPIRLAAGEKHTFRLEMFQDLGGSNMFLRWSSPTTPKQLVPASAFTPPAGFEVFPVDLSVTEDGKRLRARFEERVGDLDEVAEHLKIEADTTAMPVTSVKAAPGDRTSLLVTLAKPVQKNQQVRFTYDGEGGLRQVARPCPGSSATPRTPPATGSPHRGATSWTGRTRCRSTPARSRCAPSGRTSTGPGSSAVRRRASNRSSAGTWTRGSPCRSPPESRCPARTARGPLFYRKLVEVPKNWKVGQGKRLKLHFGAVDYQARVWVNGRKVAEHTGGYTAFSADITDALKGRGAQEVVVAVTDTGGADQPTGKQHTSPSGIFYTQTSGIWQTVWMEPRRRHRH